MLKFDFKKIILYSIVLFIVLFAYYVLTSNGLGNKPFYLQLRRFIPMSIICVLTTSVILTQTSKKFFASFAIASALWMLVYPIIYKINFYKTVPFFSHHFDIVFACYSFVGLTSLSIIALCFHLEKIWRILLSFVQLFLITIPILEIIYRLYYGTAISEAAILSIYQTNKEEAKEFIMQNIGYGGIFAAIILVICCFAFLYVLNTKNLQLINKAKLAKKQLIFLFIAGITATVYSFTNALPQTGLFQLNTDVRNYFSAIQKFKSYHDKNYQSLQVLHKDNLQKPHTIILVIGESASRVYMSAFNKNAYYDSTPWLKSQKDNPNFYIFPHAYSSWGQTVPSLERALTTKNQYNDVDFNQSTTIIDIAKKAGYYTSWFSNQGTIDVADTPITLVGKTADTAIWTNQDNSVQQYDGSLLKYLKAVDPTKNNFIVLHFMGSHDNYQNRYPREFAKWGNPDVNEPVIDYHNSLYYSDYVLSQIYQYSKENLNLQAMIYFSDHGARPDYKRVADKFGFTSLRVPLFVYMADSYKKAYPQIAQNIETNHTKYFTNDLIYDLVCGLLDIQSNQYNPEQSILSKNYKFTKETLTTRLGKTSLAEDGED